MINSNNTKARESSPDQPGLQSETGGGLAPFGAQRLSQALDGKMKALFFLSTRLLHTCWALGVLAMVGADSFPIGVDIFLKHALGAWRG